MKGTRSLQVIGDAVPSGARVLPGSTLEIELAAPTAIVHLTFYDGGIQVDCAAPCSEGSLMADGYGSRSPSEPGGTVAA